MVGISRAIRFGIVAFGLVSDLINNSPIRGFFGVANGERDKGNSSSKHKR